ncbi:MAG: hypothetical protein GXP16_15400 [Gammaproteobacteria bacterium]|nr:hypothetical protein [Gammaproteobacteria bacterium]
MSQRSHAFSSGWRTGESENWKLRKVARARDGHCANAIIVAEALELQESVSIVRYPSLQNHPSYAIAKRQMTFEDSRNKRYLRSGCWVLRSVELSEGLDCRSGLVNSGLRAHG